ncbi:hypothetical protein C0J52_07531 [Blattella germanica]|nr:hypothetical protein C0J52_07531 [Blattella germanica]
MHANPLTALTTQEDHSGEFYRTKFQIKVFVFCLNSLRCSIFELTIDLSMMIIYISLLVIILTILWKKGKYFIFGFTLPGPPGLPLLGNLLSFRTRHLNKFFENIFENLNIYGHVVRFWLGPILLILVSGPDEIAKIVENDKIGNRGVYSKTILGPMFRNSLLCMDVNSWRPHRKIVSAAFHIKILEKFVDNFAKNSMILTDRLKQFADGSTAVDIAPYLCYCTLDIISETCFAFEIKAQVNNDPNPLANIKTITDISTLRVTDPLLIFDWIFNFTKLAKKYNAAVKYYHDLIRKVIQKKTQSGSYHPVGSKPTLIDLLIENGELSHDEILGEVSSIGGAGTETTATACCFVLAMLGEHQDVQEKVLEEQKRIFSDDIFRPVDSQDLTSMVIPSGASMLIAAYHTHRDPKYFPEPDRFDPERFTSENVAGRHPYAFIPFGIGRRMCVGRVFSIMEAKTILSTVLRYYHIKEVEGGIEGLQRDLHVSIVLTASKGVKLKFLPRTY